MDFEKLNALAADTCWLCKHHAKDLHLVVLSNAQGVWDIRFDYLCTSCMMAMNGVGSN